MEEYKKIMINLKSSIMVFFITIMLTLSSPVISIAEHRIAIPTYPDYYYDTDNVIKKNEFLQAWIIIDYSKLKGERKAKADYTKELFEIDCKGNKLKHIKSVFINNNKTILSKGTPNPEWIQHSQESPSYKLIEFICDREWTTKK